MKVISRAEAKTKGSKRFFTGIPCKNGHVAERFVSDKSCMACRLERAKKWFDAHREQKRAYDKRYVKENRKKRTEYMKAWAKQNRDKAAIHERNAYALRKGAKGKLDQAQVELLLRAQNHKCAYCRKLLKRKFHLDHIKPLSKGGKHEFRNFQLLCPKCNTSKGKSDPLDFARTQGLLV